MTEIETLRHSCAHVLATAILRIWPEAQFAAGPPVENGFYYDLDLPHRITPEDFARIEEEMKKEVKANHRFERVEVSREQALELARKGQLAALSDRAEPSRFKLDIVQNIPDGEVITLYRNGDFTDLCAGPHVSHTGRIGAFKLTHVASAYYKGDERNPQLQRIYGTAFKNKTEMEAYFKMLEEARKRDHRKLGREMELFCFDEDVGPGLPLWLPKGAVLIEELEKLAKETEFAAGYQRVRTPHVSLSVCSIRSSAAKAARVSSVVLVYVRIAHHYLARRIPATPKGVRNMKRRLALAGISVLTCLLVLTPSVCFAMMEIEIVSKDRAKELGLEVRANAAGPDAVRVEVEFEAKGALEKYSRADLEIRDGGRLLSSSTLREEKSKPGRVVVSFAADRTMLNKITVRVVTEHGPRTRTGHDIRVGQHVDLDKVR